MDENLTIFRQLSPHLDGFNRHASKQISELNEELLKGTKYVERMEADRREYGVPSREAIDS